MNVGELRKLLDGQPDDTHVVVADDEGWYTNVDSVVRPSDDEDYSCVTLFLGAPWDARSL